MQQEVERSLERKAEDLVGQLVGAGNARVQVSADMNFDRVERTVQSVDPDRQVVSTEQKAEITPGAEGGAGSSNVATSYENSRSVETVSGAVGGLKRLSVAVLVNDNLVPDADSTKPATVVPRTAQEIQRIESLVRSAVGFDSTRGDVVSVVSMPFAAPQLPVDDEAAPTLMERVSEHQQSLLGAFGLLLAFVVAVMAIRAIKAAPALGPGTTPTLAAAGANASLAAGTASAQPAPPAPPRPAVLEPRAPTNTALLRDQVLTGVDQSPDVAVRLVRSWMKES